MIVVATASLPLLPTNSTASELGTLTVPTVSGGHRGAFGFALIETRLVARAARLLAL